MGREENLGFEVTPPGYEDVVQALKKQPGVENPWAVAWAMKNREIVPVSKNGTPHDPAALWRRFQFESAREAISAMPFGVLMRKGVKP